MIKVNVILGKISWKKYILNPTTYIDSKVRLINKKKNDYKNKLLIFTLLLSGTNEIKKLNTKFRKKNKTTDVLSFPFYEKNILKQKILKNKEIYLGDIIININKIKNKKNNLQFQKEFNKLWIHGLAHLLGYKHKKIKDFESMDKLEKEYLGCIY